MKDAVCFPLCSCAALSCCCSSTLLRLLPILCQICAAAGLALLGAILSSFSQLTALAGNGQVAVGSRIPRLAAPGLGTDAWTGKEGSPSWSRQQVSSDPP